MKHRHRGVITIMEPKSDDAARPARAGKPVKVILAILCGCILLFVAVNCLLSLGHAMYKQDSANTMGNLRRIYNRLEEYKAEHGSYPEQQNMRSLLQTLGMGDGDLAKLNLFDINSAVYQAPVNDADDPVLSMYIKWRLFDKYVRLVILKDGMEYAESDGPSGMQSAEHPSTAPMFSGEE